MKTRLSVRLEPDEQREFERCFRWIGLLDQQPNHEMGEVWKRRLTHAAHEYVHGEQAQEVTEALRAMCLVIEESEREVRTYFTQHGAGDEDGASPAISGRRQMRVVAERNGEARRDIEAAMSIIAQAWGKLSLRAPLSQPLEKE